MRDAIRIHAESMIEQNFPSNVRISIWTMGYFNFNISIYFDTEELYIADALSCDMNLRDIENFLMSKFSGYKITVEKSISIIRSNVSQIAFAC